MKQIIDIETTGLNPISDRILCISVLNEEGTIPSSFYGEDEEFILKQFWISIKNATELITFNGDAFDIPFIIIRSIINNVRILRKFNNAKIIDLRKVVNSFFISYYKYVKGTLSDWARVLGIESKTNNGSQMPSLYEKKDWKSIKQHSEEDCVITQKLYKRCVEVWLI